MKSFKWIGIGVVILVVLGAMFDSKLDSKGVGNSNLATTAMASPTVAPSTDPKQAIANSPETAPETTYDLTASQNNAVRSAKQYLSVQGFSRRGLIRQLSSDAGDGYKVLDATIAVDSLDVDWNQEAEKSARQYLSVQGFSCKGLIRQLSSSAGEGYTESQARHGAKQAGAC
ncbi:Ltp family lipoprotein [Chromobacterium subtsugae]|uniref:Ltp family lipoprotein n=1 Tax=Chromobacterium subtsugae TaxID=251747 RepID=UPI0009BA6B49|nr:Ltp family lipoprotein [Chromobacterium subtsugae]